MDFKKLYFTLFNTLSDAVEHINTRDYEEARLLLIHAHVQISIMHIGKSTTSIIELWRGNPKVKHKSIHLANTKTVQIFIYMGKVIAHCEMSASDIFQPFCSCCNGSVILIYAYQRCLF